MLFFHTVDKECNPSLLSFVYNSDSTGNKPSNVTTTTLAPNQQPTAATISADSILGMFIWLACILYSRCAPAVCLPFFKICVHIVRFCCSIRSASGFDKLAGTTESTLIPDVKRRASETGCCSVMSCPLDVSKT